MRRAPRVFWGPRWHPVPWGSQSPAAGPGEGQSGRWCFGAPTEAGRNPGGILISCQSKQKRREVTRYLLRHRIQHLRLGPRPMACAGPSTPGHCRGKHPGSTTTIIAQLYQFNTRTSCGVQCSPGVQLWPRTLQQPLDEAFAVVGNEDFVCQRRKLGWNLQEESLSRMAKNYYISFPEGASNCAGTQQCVPERHKRGEYPKVILGEGSLSWEEFGNSQTPLPASVCS